MFLRSFVSPALRNTYIAAVQSSSSTSSFAAFTFLSRTTTRPVSLEITRRHASTSTDEEGKGAAEARAVSEQSTGATSKDAKGESSSSSTSKEGGTAAVDAGGHNAAPSKDDSEQNTRTRSKDVKAEKP